MSLFIDTETTGLPERGSLPYGHYPPYEQIKMYDSSRIVQISIILCNEQFEQIEMKDFIVKADGFLIRNSSFHGITNEISENKGIPFAEIARELSSYLKQVTHVIAHNADFDLNIIKSELQRTGLTSIIEELNEKKVLCTMKHTKQIVKSRNRYGIKDPSLSELYRFVFEKDIENAHDSKYDVINLHKIIKTMHDTQKLNCKENIKYTPKINETEIIHLENSSIFKETMKQSDKVMIDFNKLKLIDLQKYCKENGIKGYTKMNKSKIIETIKTVIS